MKDNNKFDQNGEINHFRVWFIAAINLIPNFGGALASLIDSYSSKDIDNSEQLNAIHEEIKSIKASSEKYLYPDASSAAEVKTDSTPQDDPPVFKQIASIPAGTGFLGGQREIWHFDLSIDGKYIAAVRYGRTGGKIYSAKTGELLQSIGGFPNGLYIHRSKLLFNPNVKNIPVIAIGGYDKHGATIDIYWKYFSHKFKKKKSLYLSDDGDLDHLNSDGWSPDGRYYVTGSYSQRLDCASTNEEKYKMIAWNVFTEESPFYIPVNNSLEGGDLYWHKNSQFLLVCLSGSIVIDLKAKKYFLLNEIEEKLSYFYSAEFHPKKSWLGVTNGYDFYIINLETKKVIQKFNDAQEEKVKVNRKYRYKDHSLYDTEFHYYTSHLAFSPNGKYLATSDYFGNVVIRNCDDFSILHHHTMPTHAKSKPMYLHFLPSDNAGLIIDTCDETETRGLWYVDARYSGTPKKVSSGIQLGELKWCDVGILLSKFKHAINVYRFE